VEHADLGPDGALRRSLYYRKSPFDVQEKKTVASLFAKNKEHEVQRLTLNLVNNNCPGLTGLADGPRWERRVNLTLVVLVIPLEKGRPQIEDRFTAVTKEFNSRGVSLVLNECRGADELIVGFRWERTMKFVLAQARHLNPMGGGFWQLGLRLKQLVTPDDYPELENLRL